MRWGFELATLATTSEASAWPAADEDTFDRVA